MPEKTNLMKSFFYHLDDRYYIYNVIDSDLSQEQVEAFYKATDEYVNKVQNKQFTYSVDSYSYLENNQGLMFSFEQMETISRNIGSVEIVSDKAQYKNKYIISFEYD